MNRSSRFGLVILLLLAAACDGATAQPSTVILVRHAERAAAPDGDPVLTDAGTQRAQDLLAALAFARVGSIITTQFQRTQLTAKPLADSVRLTPIVVSAGGPTQRHVDAVAAAVKRRPAGEVVLVVGHSNTIPAIVRALGGPIMPDLCDNQYSMLFVLELPSTGEPRFIRAKYGAADPADSEVCARMMRP
jgi:broad specificity phosphatase PhoE